MPRGAYRAAYPAGDGTRHISDISVTDSGRIIASSAADADDDGPFDSADALLGTDDETLGGYVRTMPFCEA
ncbi:hypothetical protein ACFWCA_40265 [Streptomyces phaeochromogenes]|uniref:hypothetical protein n=1 Tax=Streptomyces phaeochromogenes TaxID=1923 RepID=UPI0036CA7E45